MAKILIPTPLRKFTNMQSSVEISGASLKEVLLQLSDQFPEIRKHILDSNLELRGFVRIFIGEDDIDDLDGLASVVSPQDSISIIPAIAGG